MIAWTVVSHWTNYGKWSEENTLSRTTSTSSTDCDMRSAIESFCVPPSAKRSPFRARSQEKRVSTVLDCLQVVGCWRPSVCAVPRTHGGVVVVPSHHPHHRGRRYRSCSHLSTQSGACWRRDPKSCDEKWNSRMLFVRGHKHLPEITGFNEIVVTVGVTSSFSPCVFQWNMGAQRLRRL